jgi:hypothetical protein
MTADRAHVRGGLATARWQDVWNAFVELVSSNPGVSLTAEQRPAALVFWYESEVQNGGHLQYFSNRGVKEGAETVDALQRLGAPAHAAVLKEALNATPDTLDASPVSVDEYIDIAMDDPYGQFDEAFQTADPPLQDVLEAYLKSHLAEFVSFEESEA